MKPALALEVVDVAAANGVAFGGAGEPKRLFEDGCFEVLLANILLAGA